MHRQSTSECDARRRRRSTAFVDIRLLGGFDVRVEGAATPAAGWSRRSAAAVVKLLALTPGHVLHREQLMDLLWPDESPEQCAPRLHKAAHFARRAAGRQDAVVLKDDLVRLFPDAEISVDAVRFEEFAREAVSRDDVVVARTALAWYGGELLPQDRYEEWASDRRELLHLRRLDVLRVAEEWRDVAELDPTHEPAHLELIRRHVADGDSSFAVQQYEHLERVLDRENGFGSDALVGRHGFGRLIDRSPRSDATSSARIDRLVGELASLAGRRSEVLAELARLGASPGRVAAANVGDRRGVA